MYLYRYCSVVKEHPWAVHLKCKQGGWCLFKCFYIHLWKSAHACDLHSCIVS